MNFSVYECEEKDLSELWRKEFENFLRNCFPGNVNVKLEGRVFALLFSKDKSRFLLSMFNLIKGKDEKKEEIVNLCTLPSNRQRGYANQLLELASASWEKPKNKNKTIFITIHEKHFLIKKLKKKNFILSEKVNDDYWRLTYRTPTHSIRSGSMGQFNPN